VLEASIAEARASARA